MESPSNSASGVRSMRRKQAIVELKRRDKACSGALGSGPGQMSFALLRGKHSTVHTIGPSVKFVDYASSASSDSDSDVGYGFDNRAVQTTLTEEIRCRDEKNLPSVVPASTQWQINRGEPFSPRTSIVIFLEVDPNWDPFMGDATFAIIEWPPSK